MTGEYIMNTDRLRKFLGENYEDVIRYTIADAFADCFKSETGWARASVCELRLAAAVVARAGRPRDSRRDAGATKPLFFPRYRPAMPRVYGVQEGFAEAGLRVCVAAFRRERESAPPMRADRRRALSPLR